VATRSPAGEARDLHRRALRTATPTASRAVRASMIAPTKHMLEMPCARGCARRCRRRHAHEPRAARIHPAFASGAMVGVDAMVARIYEDLLVPIDDPALSRLDRLRITRAARRSRLRQRRQRHVLVVAAPRTGLV
jgi:hypothetical protein